MIDYPSPRASGPPAEVQKQNFLEYSCWIFLQQDLNCTCLLETKKLVEIMSFVVDSVHPIRTMKLLFASFAQIWALSIYSFNSKIISLFEVTAVSSVTNTGFKFKFVLLIVGVAFYTRQPGN